MRQGWGRYADLVAAQGIVYEQVGGRGWGRGQVPDLGHSGAGKVPRPGANVLPRRARYVATWRAPCRCHCFAFSRFHVFTFSRFTFSFLLRACRVQTSTAYGAMTAIQNCGLFLVNALVQYIRQHYGNESAMLFFCVADALGMVAGLLLLWSDSKKGGALSVPSGAAPDVAPSINGDVQYENPFEKDDAFLDDDGEVVVGKSSRKVANELACKVEEEGDDF